MTAKILLILGAVLVVSAVGVAVWKVQSSNCTADCKSNESACSSCPEGQSATPAPTVSEQPVVAEAPKTPDFKLKFVYCTS